VAAIVCVAVLWGRHKLGEADSAARSTPPQPSTGETRQASVPATPAWPELPATDPDGELIRVTHWVTSDGKRLATGDTPGRVRNFTIAFDPARRQPLWVAAPMHRWYREPRGTGRTDYWNFDPQIAQRRQPYLARSYRGDYSRGHLVASADRLREWALNAQTFYFTNMAPQITRGFNDSRSAWTRLEQRVQSWGDAAADTLYVVTGSAFLGDGPGGGIDTTFDNDGHRVPVPSHFYKVLLSARRATGRPIAELGADELRAAGFWIPHSAEGERRPEAYMTSVAEIERLTGVEFFPWLSAGARSVKASFDAKDWLF
jgi:endonuclease G